MKYFLLFVIRVYWIIPKKYRNTCLFRKSCSHFVFETTRNEGFLIGLKALAFRIKNCRPYYSLIVKNDTILMVSANHQVFEESEIAVHLLNKQI